MGWKNLRRDGGCDLELSTEREKIAVDVHETNDVSRGHKEICRSNNGLIMQGHLMQREGSEERGSGDGVVEEVMRK